MNAIFIDGNDLRVAELAQIIPGLAVTVEALQTGFSTAAPEPTNRARDKVLAHPVSSSGAGQPSSGAGQPSSGAGQPAPLCSFAEAVDLTTMEGKSLRLELDSENENRFCKWWRETPSKMVLAIALRRAPGADIELFTATCEGRIADKPAGPHKLGWDRLFVPADPDADNELTLAQLSEAGVVVALRRTAYGEVAKALGL